MPSPVALTNPKFAASYNSFEKILTVFASGQIKSVVLDAWLERDKHFVGGLKYNLVGYYGGLGHPPPLKPYETNPPLKERINLPQPHFNSKSVTIETDGQKYTVPIQYIWLNENANTPIQQLAENANFDKTATDANDAEKSPAYVLPAIDVYLPGGETLDIPVRIPTESAYYTISPNFDKNFLRLETVAVVDGVIHYSFQWAKDPTEPGTNPQLLEVTTVERGGIDPISIEKTQAWAVHWVVLNK